MEKLSLLELAFVHGVFWLAFRLLAFFMGACAGNAWRLWPRSSRSQAHIRASQLGVLSGFALFWLVLQFVPHTRGGARLFAATARCDSVAIHAIAIYSMMIWLLGFGIGYRAVQALYYRQSHSHRPRSNK